MSSDDGMSPLRGEARWEFTPTAAEAEFGVASPEGSDGWTPWSAEYMSKRVCFSCGAQSGPGMMIIKCVECSEYGDDTW